MLGRQANKMPTQNIIFNFRPDVANYIWRSFTPAFKKFLDGWEITSAGANINPDNSDKFKHDLLKLMNEHKRVPDEVLDSANSDKWGEVISIRYYFYNVPNARVPRFITQFKKQFDIYYRQDLLLDHSAIENEWECEWVVGQRTQYDFPSDQHPDKFGCRPEEVCRINTTDRSVFPPSITISRAPSLGYDAYPLVKNDYDEIEDDRDGTPIVLTGATNHPITHEHLRPPTEKEYQTMAVRGLKEDFIPKGLRPFEYTYEDFRLAQKAELKVLAFYDSCMTDGLNPQYWDEDTLEYLYPDCAEYSINKYMSDRDIKNYAEFKAVMIKERLGEN